MAATPHLVGAIRDFLLAHPIVAPLLPGGIADGQADRDTQLAYLVLEAKDSSHLRLFGGREVATVHVSVAVYATGRSTAETAGAAVRAAILPPDDVPAWSPLGIADGWIDVNRQPAGGEAVEIDPETRAAYGRDVWCCRKPISWTLAKG